MPDQFHTSVTERGSFKDCRRRWYYETIGHLTPKGNVAFALDFGTAIHAGLEGWYRSGGKKRVCQNWFKKEWTRVDNYYAEYYKGLYKLSLEQAWWEFFLLGKEMLDNYMDYDEREAWFDEVIEVNIEERGFVQILGPDGNPLPGSPLLSGRIDLLVRKKKDYWVWDHKTAAQKPNFGALDVDDQGTGYCYVTWRNLGIVPRGFMYNVLLKRVPSPPELIRNDTALSTRKDRSMTYECFVNAVKENGFSVGDYAEHLAELRKRGYSDFFVRDGSRRNLEQLRSFGERVRLEYKDMQSVIEDPTLAYPNMNQRNCPGCAIMPLCLAHEEDGDVEDIIENQYLVEEPRVKIPKEMQVGTTAHKA